MRRTFLVIEFSEVDREHRADISPPGWPGGGSEVQQLISAERNS